MQLEEFRRKRAAKKATSANVINEKQPSEAENVRLPHSNGVGTSDALAEGRLETSTVPKIPDKEYDIPAQSSLNSSSDKNVTSSLSDRSNDVNAPSLVHSYTNNEDYRDETASIQLEEYQSAKDKFQSSKGEYDASVETASGIGKNSLFGHKVSSTDDNHALGYFTSDGLYKYPSNDLHRPEKDVPLFNSSTPSNSAANIMPKNSVTSLGNSIHEDNKLTTSYPGKTISLEHVSLFSFDHYLFSYLSSNFLIWYVILLSLMFGLLVGW